MANKLVWFLFSLISASLFVFFLNYPVHTSGGDIVEYFGMTQSLINHGGVNLTDKDYNDLKKYLNPGYFVNTNEVKENGGFLYYMKGKDSERYPVHFLFYSLLCLPVRIILHLFHLNELLTLRIANLIILSGMVIIVFLKFIKTAGPRFLFLLLTYLSPIAFFIIWPGPDIFYISMLMLAIFLFYGKKYKESVILLAFASWHSQPLIVLALGALSYYFFSTSKIVDFFKKKNIHIDPSVVIYSIILFLLIILPYLFNYFVFGVFTPWTILKDGWTQLNGFGIQNISMQKLFEQFFDPNVGLIWYAPVLFLVGCYYLFKSVKVNLQDGLVVIIIFLTAMFYQTNPAWHYGTAGYGPTRHIIFIIPFLIFFIVRGLQNRTIEKLALLLIVVTQIFSLSINGYFSPKFENSLVQSPYAQLILNHFPRLYNPTPEIFVDRTNHTDLKYLETAIYSQNGKCQKAFVLYTDKESVEKECGLINLPISQKGTYVTFD